MTLKLTDLLFILVIFQLLVLCCFLYTRKTGRRVSNRLLGTFFLSICLNLLDVFLLRTGLYFTYPSLAGWGSCLPLTFGPLLYCYTQSVIYKDFSITIKRAGHFLPFLVFFFITEFLYLRLPADSKMQLLTRLLNHRIAAGFVWVSGIILLQFLFYAILSLREISRYKKATNQLFSNPQSTGVSWLYSTIVFFIVMMVITTLNGLLAQSALAKYYLLAFNLVLLVVLVYIIRVVLKALDQSHFFSFAGQADVSALSVFKTKLNESEKNEREKIVQSAKDLMKNNKPYLDPELTLDQLATLLSLKPRALSQAINEILNQNFFDFINRYRIEEAAKLLANPVDKKITVLEILYEVGFNSKSSFNALFKKYMGLTPTEFKRNQAK
jgi:AraC-like DNA-binding protein